MYVEERERERERERQREREIAKDAHKRKKVSRRLKEMEQKAGII